MWFTNTINTDLFTELPIFQYVLVLFYDMVASSGLT